MDTQPSGDPFLRRLKWITIAVLVVLAVWQGLPWAEHMLSRKTAEPRAVTPRGDFAADEKNTIELFESSRDAVVFISTTQRVMEAWSRNIFTIPTRALALGFVWDDKGHVITNYHVVAQGLRRRGCGFSDGQRARRDTGGGQAPSA